MSTDGSKINLVEIQQEQLINELESLVKDNSLGVSYRAGITDSIWRIKEWFETYGSKGSDAKDYTEAQKNEERVNNAEIIKNVSSPQTETLEEVAEKEAEARYPVLIYINPKDSPYVESKETFKHGVRFGAKWQQEQMDFTIINNDKTLNAYYE